MDARLPADTPPGVHTIQLQGQASCAAQVRLVGDATIAPLNQGGRSSGLAFTGANPLVLVLIALVVLTIGFVLVAGERRHRTRRATIRRERRARREHATSTTRATRKSRARSANPRSSADPGGRTTRCLRS